MGRRPYTAEVNMESVRRRYVHDNYAPYVYGIGYKGNGKYVMLGKMYDCWHRMLGRCYDPYFLNNRPTYRNVIVEDSWHNLQTFCEWYILNYRDGYELDKDILCSEDYQVYSKDTCIFIPGRINNRVRRIRCDNTSGHKGVTFHKVNAKWMVGVIDFDTGKEKHVGYFADKDEAFAAQDTCEAKETIKAQQYMRSLGYCESIVSKIK